MVRISNRRLLVLGFGTVFGTLALFLLVMLVGIIIEGGPGDLSRGASLGILLVYAGIGVGIAIAICIAAVFPMLWTWPLVFDRMQSLGLSVRVAGTISAGIQALLASIFLLGIWTYLGQNWRIMLVAPLTGVPALVAAGLAWVMFVQKGDSALP